VLEGSKLRHESYEALRAGDAALVSRIDALIETRSWTTTRRNFDDAACDLLLALRARLAELRARVAAMDETAESLAIPRG
jgi:hypothetical protein